MYKKKEVYFISNLTNLNGKLCQFQESDKSSLSGLVLCSKNKNLCLNLPIIILDYSGGYLIYKINVKRILSKDCFIKFIYNNEFKKSEHMLKHKDVLKYEGLGWIEYQNLKYNSCKSQISIEINSIEMQIDYVRRGDGSREITHIPHMSLMGLLLPGFRQFSSNVPKIFKDREEKEVRLTKLITMIMMKLLIIKHQIDCFINLNEDDIKQLEIKEDEEALLEKLNDISKDYTPTKSDKLFVASVIKLVMEGKIVSEENIQQKGRFNQLLNIQ
ncbi:hypothetical protein RhiirA4_484826 [Rhizophagus irregularis]|uniref:Uncharacterized protein n=1 Tax=Rhizophagus irregularis TaxID=588596 RepID=A0A2I1HPF9_9GLOM|nr:hypothetical protein RhiirA4_484826 [Rhizophagus irregularis]